MCVCVCPNQIWNKFIFWTEKTIIKKQEDDENNQQEKWPKINYGINDVGNVQTATKRAKVCVCARVDLKIVWLFEKKNSDENGQKKRDHSQVKTEKKEKNKLLNEKHFGYLAQQQ